MKRPRTSASLLALVALSGCLPRASLPEAASEPNFDPIAFFTGRSAGVGTLSTITGDNSALRVSSLGRRNPDGSLTLDQRIATAGEPTRTRRWIIRPLGGGRYGGTLTEAIGPVEAEVRGNRMMIRYQTRGYGVDQQLVLGSDGHVHNRLDVVKWGMKVARINEVIRKLDGSFRAAKPSAPAKEK